MLIDLIAPSDPTLATVITATLESDCGVSVTGPVVVDKDRVGLGSPTHLLAASKLSSSVDPGAEILAASVSTKRAVSQSFDPVGILMTEESLFVRYWWSGEQIADVYVELAESHHVEANGGGWYLDGFSLARTAGCIGCGSIEYRGTVDWGYRGVFDPTGTLFHNRHVNTVTAFGTGQARCTFSITWRNSLPGWSKRFICTS